MTNLVKCRDLRLGYGSTTMSPCPDFTVGAGDCVSIVGPNGAGKTTLLKCIAGLLKPLGGTLALAPGLADGEDFDILQNSLGDGIFHTVSAHIGETECSDDINVVVGLDEVIH